jgi:hypothetical protein
MSVERDLLLSVESTKGPFDLADREHASWSPGFHDAENGRTFIAAALQKVKAV